MTTAVSAYAATSATEPLTKTTITRRDVGPHDVAFDIHFAGICHSDIHTVEAEWGKPSYPWCPATRSPVSSPRSARRHQVPGRRPRRRRVLRRLLPRVRYCIAGEKQYCTDSGMVGTYNACRPRRPGHPGRLQRRDRRGRELRTAYPRRSPLDAAAPLLCAGITTVFTAAALEAGRGHPGRHRRPGRSRATWRQARRRARRQRDRAEPIAQEDGGRYSVRRRRVLRHQRSRDLREAGRIGST